MLREGWRSSAMVLGFAPMTTIAPATERDAAGIAKVYVDAWRSAYAAILPHRVLLGMSYEQQTRQWSWAIRNRAELQPVIVATEAEADQGVVGFTSFGPARRGDRPHRPSPASATPRSARSTRSMSSRISTTAASDGSCWRRPSRRWPARATDAVSSGSCATILRATSTNASAARRSPSVSERHVGLHDRPGLLRLARPRAGDRPRGSCEPG